MALTEDGHRRWSVRDGFTDGLRLGCGPVTHCNPPGLSLSLFWGAPCTVPALCKSRLFWTHFPQWPSDRSDPCDTMHGTTQILTQSRNSGNELKQTIFPTNNARLLSRSAVVALWTWLPRWGGGGGVQGGHAMVLLGVVRALCRTAPKVHPSVPLTWALLSWDWALQQGSTV